ncbi:hypothetical protein CEXT_649671 [Caerostris extrusa]|uniref:Uncharacterized protein n=1 Tax=Caerostris extrusa TaxID=172846 RepID=A0AAV4T5J2_CAEEX|nr:hypothetical protein CEXT_649671 [Caerostris extrusa]
MNFKDSNKFVKGFLNLRSKSVENLLTIIYFCVHYAGLTCLGNFKTKFSKTLYTLLAFIARQQITSIHVKSKFIRYMMSLAYIVSHNFGNHAERFRIPNAN